MHKVKVANQIVEGRFNYTALEVDILLKIIRKVSNTQYAQITFDFSEIVEDSLGDSHQNIAYVKKALKNLLTKPIEMYNVADDDYISFPFISTLRIDGKRSKIHVTIDPFITPYIINLKTNYTTLQLESLFNMESKYSKRLYMMVSQFKKTGILSIDLDDFHKRLGTDLSDSYKNFAAFCRRVLDVAIDEVNKFSELDIKRSDAIRGKSTEKVIIYIKLKEKLTDVQGDVKQTARLLSYGLKDWHVRNIQLTLSEDEINAELYKISLRMANKEIKNVGGYVRTIFENLGVPFDSSIPVQSKLFA